MIINLEPRGELVNSFLEQINTTDQVLLDLMNVCEKRENLQQIQLDDLDPLGNFRKKALAIYVEDISKINQTKFANGITVKDFKIIGIPIYWFTDFSIKHKGRHWGQSLYVLRELLISYPSIFESVTSFQVILPSNRSYIDTLVKAILKDATNKKVEIIGRKTPSFSSKTLLIASIKFVLDYFRLWWKFQKIKRKLGKENVSLPSNQFIGPDEEQTIINDLVAYAKSLNNGYKIPIRMSWTALRNRKWEQKDKQLCLSYPTIPFVFKILKETWQCFHKVKKISNFSLGILNPTLHFAHLHYEYFTVIHRPDLFFTHSWLVRYFKQLKKPTKLFYEDEFYKSGRLLSLAQQAANNSLLTTYGIQHIPFEKNNTVYTITDLELQEKGKNDGLPIPNKFAVWDEATKAHFLKWNSLPQDYVIVTGRLENDRNAQTLWKAIFLKTTT